MEREAICPKCRTEVAINDAGRCKVCGWLIMEPIKKKKKK